MVLSLAGIVEACKTKIVLRASRTATTEHVMGLSRFLAPPRTLSSYFYGWRLAAARQQAVESPHSPIGHVQEESAAGRVELKAE